MKLTAFLLAPILLASGLVAAPATRPDHQPRTGARHPVAATDVDPNMVDPGFWNRARAAEAAVRTAIAQLRSGKVDYSTMTDELHKQLAPQVDRIHAILAGVGDLKMLRTVIMDKQANVIFLRATFANGADYDWAVQLTPDGKMAQLALRPAQD